MFLGPAFTWDSSTYETWMGYTRDPEKPESGDARFPVKVECTCSRCFDLLARVCVCVCVCVCVGVHIGGRSSAPFGRSGREGASVAMSQRGPCQNIDREPHATPPGRYGGFTLPIPSGLWVRGELKACAGLEALSNWSVGMAPHACTPNRPDCGFPCDHWREFSITSFSLF